MEPKDIHAFLEKRNFIITSEVIFDLVNEVKKQKHEWVGLTDEEFQDLCDQYHDDKIITVENLLLATEALLKGKNT